jgi:hypothetical protein
MDLFSFLSFHFMCMTVTVVTGHSMALNRRSHLFSTMSSLHDVLVHVENISVKVTTWIEGEEKVFLVGSHGCFQCFQIQ